MVYFLVIAFSMMLWLANTPYAAAAGKTYYVATNGNDGNPCSQSSPCRTIVHGASLLHPGDTLYVRSGTYNERPGSADAGNPTLPQGTSWSSPITIAVYPGDTVTMQGFSFDGTQYIVVDGFIIDGVNYWQTGIGLGTGPIRVKNTEIKNALLHGALGCDGGSCEFYNIHVHHIAYSGTWNCPTDALLGGNGYCHGLYLGHSNNNIIDGSEFDHIGGYGVHPNPGDNWTITRNLFHHNWDGFLIYGVGYKVYNNVSYANHGYGMVSYGSGATIYNNTFANNPNSAMTLHNSGYTIRNNIFYGNGGTIEWIDGSGGSTINTNLTTNPSFVNAAAGDFHLQAGSPAIDAGVTISEVTTDRDKTPRPQGARFDIGAYQYTGSAPRPLSAPTNRRKAGR